MNYACSRSSDSIINLLRYKYTWIECVKINKWTNKGQQCGIFLLGANFQYEIQICESMCFVFLRFLKSPDNQI